MSSGETELCADTWRRIATLWASLAAVPIARPDQALTVLWDGIEEFVHHDQAYLVIAQQREDAKLERRLGTVDGWIPTVLFHRHETSPERHAIIDQYRREHLPDDPAPAYAARTSGRHRTFRREEILGPGEDWGEVGTGWLLGRLGVRDRMYCVHALDELVEVHFGFDRVDGDFARAEAVVLQNINTGLGPFLGRLAMSYGVFAYQSILRPRERETLLHLLDGHSEAEIAEIMGISHGTVHQYAVSVFRSLNVNSRPELMAKWMNDVPA